MSALLFALVAALLAGVASREQLLMAADVARRGRQVATLLAAAATSALTCALAAGLGSAGLGLPDRTRELISGLCWVVAALALVWRSRRAIPDPAALPLPRPLAMAALLLTFQANGALPLAVAGAVLLRGHWGFAAVGGTIGAMIPLALAWLLGADMAKLPTAWLRRAAAGLLGAAGAVVAASAA